MAIILPTTLDPHEHLQAFMQIHAGAGAISSFVGSVRSDLGKVTALELQCYEGVTEPVLAQIEEAATSRFGLLATCVVHRVGRLLPHDPIVVVIAAAAHRKEAIDGVDYIMDRLKTDAPFWKKEISLSGSKWIEPRQSDQTARAKWNQNDGE